MPYEVPNLANQNSRTLGVVDRKLEERHSLFGILFDRFKGGIDGGGGTHVTCRF